MESKLQQVKAFLSKIEGEGLMEEHQAFLLKCEHEMIGGTNHDCTNQSTACEDTNARCTNKGNNCNKLSDNIKCNNLIIQPDPNTPIGCTITPKD